MNKVASEWFNRLMSEVTSEHISLTPRQVAAIKRYVGTVAGSETETMQIAGKPMLTGAPVAVHHRGRNRSPSLHVTASGGVATWTREGRPVRGRAAWAVVAE